MTSYVNQFINGSIEMFANYEITINPSGNFYTWYRSLNTQEWLGPFPLAGDPPTVFVNKRFSRWYADTSSIPNFSDQHRNGFYQYCTTPPIPSLTQPTVGVANQGIIKLIFDPGGDTNMEAYVSNNEQREADTYFRPNY
jgi:hypothetical protein